MAIFISYITIHNIYRMGEDMHQACSQAQKVVSGLLFYKNIGLM